MRRFLTSFIGVLLLGWLAAPVLVHAQNASIQGRVSDAQTKKALPGTSIVLMRAGTEELISGTATDREGRYELRDVPEGLYDLVVRYVGYREVRRAVSLTAGEYRTANVGLSPGVNMNPVVVSVSRDKEEWLDAPATTIELEGMTFLHDPVSSAAASLRNTVGVDIAQTGVDRYQVALRGFNETFVSRVRVLVNNWEATTPIFTLNQYAAMPLSPLDLERAELSLGPGSALYGSGLEQGVIHFFTKDPLTYPGTTMMFGGGNQSIVQGSLRHAGTVGDDLGYKVVGYYSQAQDFAFDREDPQDLDVLCAIARGSEGGASDCTRNESGVVTDVNNLASRDSDTYKGYLAGTLQYEFSPETKLDFVTGFSRIKQALQANTGEIMVDGFTSLFAQTRFKSGPFSAQTYVNHNDAGNTYIIRSGSDVVDNSVQVVTQGQYDWNLATGRQEFSLGGDFQYTVPKTAGTINGINEERDEFSASGVWLNSKTRLLRPLDLVVAGRVDYNSAVEETQFSPRAGLVYRVDPVHTLRATHNRAFTNPAGINLFLDIPVQHASAYDGLFGMRGRGAATAFTFSENDLVSLTPPVADATGQERLPLGQLPLAGLYDYGLGLVAESGALGETLAGFGLTGDQAAQVRDALAAASADVSGQIGGQTLIGGEPATAQNTDKLDQPVTSTFELGYKGLIEDQFSVGMDVYYARKNHFVSGLQQITPTVVGGAEGAEALTAALSGAVGGDLADLGLTPDQTATLIELLAETASTTPYGIIEPEENVLRAGGAPEILMTYLNFGQIDYYGADLALDWQMNDHLRVFGLYSWVSENFFDADDLDETNANRVISTNAPRNKAKGGFAYDAPSSGLSFKASAQYNDGFEVRSGVYQGDVESYFLINVGAGFEFDPYVAGLRMDVLGSNILDNEHREYIGAPEIGRVVTMRMIYSF